MPQGGHVLSSLFIDDSESHGLSLLRRQEATAGQEGHVLSSLVIDDSESHGLSLLRRQEATAGQEGHVPSLSMAREPNGEPHGSSLCMSSLVAPPLLSMVDTNPERKKTTDR
jgi:hypothetical protein